MEKENQFDYYYGIEAEQFAFFRIPKALIQEARFKGLSTDAKLLYGLMLDRMSLSMKNGWLDDQNRVYIIYTLENVMADLQCGKDKGVKILAELDTVKGIGLIERKKRGLGKPAIIYVKNFITSKPTLPALEGLTAENQKSKDENNRMPEVGKTEVFSTKKQDSESQETRSLDFGEKDSIYTELSEIYKSQNNPINPSKVDGIICFMEKIKENIDYAYYMEHGNVREKELVEELYQLICDIVCVEREYVTIGGVPYPYAMVKEKFLKIRQPHIEYVLESMKKMTAKIGNIRAYLLTTLYYAPTTINFYYQQEMQKDLYGND